MDAFETMETVGEYADQLQELNMHLANLENICLVVLIAVGLCFGAICCVILARYLKG